MSRIETGDALMMGGAAARQANVRSLRARIAMTALGMIGLFLGFVSGVVLIFATGLVALC